MVLAHGLSGLRASAQVPTHTITILLGLTFCCMNPLLPMMALIYFLINSLTEKYNMMYVMRARFQSGGRVRFSALFSRFSGKRGCVPYKLAALFFLHSVLVHDW